MASVATRILTAIGVFAALSAGQAHAGNVQWSVGIHAPIAPGVALGTVVGNGPIYAPVVVPPIYVPAPIYPVPVYATPVYRPVYAPVYAPRVVYGPAWGGHRVHHHHGYRPYPQPVAWHKQGYRGPPVYRPGREIRY